MKISSGGRNSTAIVEPKNNLTTHLTMQTESIQSFDKFNQKHQNYLEMKQSKYGEAIAKDKPTAFEIQRIEKLREATANQLHYKLNQANGIRSAAPAFKQASTIQNSLNQYQKGVNDHQSEFKDIPISQFVPKVPSPNVNQADPYKPAESISSRLT